MPAGLGLLGQQLGVDEVVGGLLLQRVLVRLLATHLLACIVACSSWAW